MKREVFVGQCVGCESNWQGWCKKNKTWAFKMGLECSLKKVKKAITPQYIERKKRVKK